MPVYMHQASDLNEARYTNHIVYVYGVKILSVKVALCVNLECV